MKKIFLIQDNFLDNIENALHRIKIRNIEKGDRVVIKVHMGEYGNLNYVRLPIVGKVVEVVKKIGGKAFLFDTLTLYAGVR